MDGLSIFLLAGTWITALVAVGGVVSTARRNGKEQAKRDQDIKNNQVHIIRRLDDDETGLTALNKKFHRFETHCASTSTEHDERIKAVERDIHDLKKKKR